ncbi:DUF998 domain-containing protein [Lentzea cavernae]|uniref:DUF998 domain-containing protein n=1 Tax=Lentzea cavernae TaxID=2020703 RepID=A0ABQ3MEQ3_9PSEU|nr:DUF998 domain-containing protein [Lentzea cavernae]GHH38729.1 hypothetical protein GCM10017774_29130 [Lentzea cavernae]
MEQAKESAPNLHRLAALGGSISVCVSLVIIWAAKAGVDRTIYVSGLGADGEPTAGAFEVALLLLVAGGYAVAWALRAAALGAAGRWTPSLSVVISSSLFLVASQVPCTYGCPVPLGDTFTWQDLTHVVSAVAGFSFAALAMVQVSVADTHPALRRLSRACGVLVAVIAAAGGVSCLLDVRTDIGSLLEFAATTVGMGWLAVIGAAVTFLPARPESGEDVEQSDSELVGVS